MEQTQPHIFYCPECDVKLSVPVEEIDLWGDCPKCSAEICATKKKPVEAETKPAAVTSDAPTEAKVKTTVTPAAAQAPPVKRALKKTSPIALPTAAAKVSDTPPRPVGPKALAAQPPQEKPLPKSKAASLPAAAAPSASEARPEFTPNSPKLAPILSTDPESNSFTAAAEKKQEPAPPVRVAGQFAKPSPAQRSEQTHRRRTASREKNGVKGWLVLFLALLTIAAIAAFLMFQGFLPNPLGKSKTSSPDVIEQSSPASPSVREMRPASSSRNSTPAATPLSDDEPDPMKGYTIDEETGLKLPPIPDESSANDIPSILERIDR